jgi:hypothetical protein
MLRAKTITPESAAGSEEYRCVAARGKCDLPHLIAEPVLRGSCEFLSRISVPDNDLIPITRRDNVHAVGVKRNRQRLLRMPAERVRLRWLEFAPINWSLGRGTLWLGCGSGNNEHPARDHQQGRRDREICPGKHSNNH